MSLCCRDGVSFECGVFFCWCIMILGECLVWWMFSLIWFIGFICEMLFRCVCSLLWFIF